MLSLDWHVGGSHLTPDGMFYWMPGGGQNFTRAEPNGYLAAIQTRDGHTQLLSSKNHYVFNLA